MINTFPLTMETILKDIYYDPSHKAGLASAQKLFRAVKHLGVSFNQVKHWLKKQKAYTLHRPVRKKFPRRQVDVQQIDEQYQIDLADMSNVSKHNKGFRYLLIVIDSFSRYCWAFPIKNKKPESIIDAFKKVLKERRPDSIFSDNGGEFVNNKFRTFLQKEGILFYTAHNQETKASIAERVIRTIKSKLYRYFSARKTFQYLNVLKKIIQSYNNSKHRSIQMAPADVTFENAHIVRERKKTKVYNVSFKYMIGESVRVSKVKHVFDKGYYPNYSDEIFTIHRRQKRQGLPLYKLKDYNGEVLEGFFYQDEIQPVEISDLWEIEKVIKTKGKGLNKQYLVKWAGYGSKFNSWVTNIYKNVERY